MNPEGTAIFPQINLVSGNTVDYRDQEITRLKTVIDFMLDQFASRDARNRAYIDQLEAQLNQAHNQISWFQGAGQSEPPKVQ